MTKRKFNQLLKQTKEHWENDILKAPASVFANDSPITKESCSVCGCFARCQDCFLKDWDGRFCCLDEVCEANDVIDEYQWRKRDNRGYSIRPVRKVCKKAYRAILKRFEEYRQKHFGRV